MRKTKEVTITAEGRDKGKKFLITEMPALQADKWGYRALGAMARSGLDIPPHVLNMGMAGIVAMGLKAVLGADFKEAEPLLDELAACVQIIMPAAPQGRTLIPEVDVEEHATWRRLRDEVFELHTGFSVAAFLFRIWTEAAERAKAYDEVLRNAATSQEPPPQ